MALMDWIIPADLLSQAMGQITHVLQSPKLIIAYSAIGLSIVLTVAGSFVRTMLPLRWLAVASNAGSLVYGALTPSVATFVLELVLLPINVYRAMQMRRLTHQVTKAATSGDTSGVWLKPYMKPRKFKKGEILFNKGDLADNLYFLASGRIEWVEIGEFLEPGRIFGEIAFFSPHKRRTLSGRCAEDCVVMSLDESTLKQLYFQNPQFGFELIGLVAARLNADLGRMERATASSQS